jgi:predicted transcriptional regulator
MPLRPLDTLIAHKMINLSELSGTQKRVAGALVDHFNRVTSQCDPSLDRIARLLNIDRRTVIRAMPVLERTGMFQKERHGGHSHRNSYEPVWSRFRQLDEQWKARREAMRSRSGQKMSPSRRQTCHLVGDEPVTQTCLNNLSKKTCLGGQAATKPPSPPGPKVGKGWPRKEESRQQLAATTPESKTSRHIQAAYSAAERRWNDAIHDRYARTPSVYAQIIEAIDPIMQSAATKLELQRRGAGVEYLLSQLQLRGLHHD